MKNNGSEVRVVSLVMQASNYVVEHTLAIQPTSEAFFILKESGVSGVLDVLRRFVVVQHLPMLKI